MNTLLLLLVSVFAVSNSCRLPLEVSKEWQIELIPELFAPRDLGILRLFQYIETIVDTPAGQQYGFKFSKSQDNAERDQRHVRYYDTTGNDFVNNGIVMRLRKWLNGSESTLPDTQFIIKGKNLLAPLAYNQPLSSGYAALNINCSAKLEQDLYVSEAHYALSSSMVNQHLLTIVGDDGQNLKSVGPVADLYPDLYGIISCTLRNITKSTPLVVASDQYRFVMEKIKFEFARKKIHGVLTLAYNSANDAQQGTVKPAAAEISWRMKSTDDNWSCNVWRSCLGIQQIIGKSIYSAETAGPVTWTCDI